MTNTTNALTIACGATVGAVAAGSIGAALGAFSGGVGAEVLDSAGHDGYDPIEAAQMGAIGGAVIDGALGALAGALASCGMFSKSKSDSERSKNSETVIGYAGNMVLLGLTGYGIMNSGDYETVMELGQTAAAFAVGGAITMLPAACGIVCLVLPCLAAVAAADAVNEQSEQENNIQRFAREQAAMGQGQSPASKV